MLHVTPWLKGVLLQRNLEQVTLRTSDTAPIGCEQQQQQRQQQQQESRDLKEASFALWCALVSLFTGAVTISRQRTRMLCCLVRTLLSPALRDHHGRALIDARGLCVPPAAGADEF